MTNDGKPVEYLFEKITLVGVGLIGSSLGRAILHKKLAKEVVGLVRSEETAKRCLAVQCVTHATTDAVAAIENTDAVILCVPMGQYSSVMEQVGGLLAHSTKTVILSDVGSVKGSALAIMEQATKKYGSDRVRIMPAHPIAGTEFSGPESGMAHLFQDMFCIMTPPDNHDKDAYDKIKKMWEGVGAKVEHMTAQHHDEVLAMTSHIPHLIAYTITGTARAFEDQIKNATKNVQSQEVIKYSAGGWRDFTRIAASDPTMWRDIFLNNKSAVLKQLESFKDDLATLTTAIENGDGGSLENWFRQTKTIRQALPSISQEIDDAEQQKKFYTN